MYFFIKTYLIGTHLNQLVPTKWRKAEKYRISISQYPLIKYSADYFLICVCAYYSLSYGYFTAFFCSKVSKKKKKKKKKKRNKKNKKQKKKTKKKKKTNKLGAQCDS